MDSKRTAVSLFRGALAITILVSLTVGCAHDAAKLPSKSAAFLVGLLPFPRPATAPPRPAGPPETAKPVEGSVKTAQLAVEPPNLWPVKDNGERVILSSFGYRGGRRGGPGSFHRAVDIRAAMNTPILASANGLVKETSNGGGYGNMVVVDHGNGFETAYAHLTQFEVEKGQRVEKGEIIALSGRTGYATCPHLHYEVRKNGEAINPVDYLPMDGVRIEQLAKLPPDGAPTPSKAAESAEKAKSPAAKTGTKASVTGRSSARGAKTGAKPTGKKAVSGSGATGASATKSTAKSSTKSGTPAKAAEAGTSAASAKPADKAKTEAVKSASTKSSAAKPKKPAAAGVKTSSSKTSAPAKQPAAKSNVAKAQTAAS
ncbi:MAG: peptidoglycan DD-metalloendopeptidase family protein [Candidatus Hydrogenedentes bacterium]|nr:peptidoglycan DD-metalloendopeptidase family protein [Candidatus Hydrogenedentota bacterium]